MNSPSFNLYRDYSNWLTLSNASELFWSWRTISKFRKRRKKKSSSLAYVLTSVAPSTRIRIFLTLQLFLSGFGFRPHVAGESAIRIRTFLNLLSRVEMFEYATNQQDRPLAPVVQKLDAIHRIIDHYPRDNSNGFPNTYPLESDLSGGWRDPAFKHLEPVLYREYSR